MAIRKKNRKQPTELQAPKSVSLVEFRLQELKREFEQQARLFKAMMDPDHGGGLECVAMLDCLRALNTRYLSIAAHTYALRSVQGHF